MSGDVSHSRVVKLWLEGVHDKDPTLSATTQAILDHLNIPNGDLDELSELVKADILLCGRIMSIVNSSFFGFPRTIAKVDEAIILLGGGKLKSIVLAHALIPSSQLKEGNTLEVIKHCFTLAVAMKVLSPLVGLDGEIAFMVGLFHDLPMLLNPPSQSEITSVKASYPAISQTLNATLLAQWQLPDVIITAVNDLYLPVSVSDYGSLLRIAHGINAMIGITHDSDLDLFDLEDDFNRLNIPVQSYVNLAAKIESDSLNMFSLLEC
jgi:HD-like signal output (HDOD) protein